MAATPKISIIVPIYNAERFLRKCIDSILNQEFNDFELVLVNDGSLDESGNICDVYASRDRRVRVFHQDNEGASSARNKGLQEAKGYYIWFVDADDWIANNCLQKIVDTLDKDNLDILQVGYFTVIKGICTPCNEKWRITTEILSPSNYVALGLFEGTVWSSIFRKQTAINHNITFDIELKLAEDQLFSLSILNFSNRIRRIEDLFYYYYSNPSSLVNTAKVKDLLLSIKKIIRFEYRNNFHSYCNNLIVNQFACCAIRMHNNYKSLDNLIREINYKEAFQNYHTKNRGNKIIARFYPIFGIRFIKLYGFLYRKFRKF